MAVVAVSHGQHSFRLLPLVVGRISVPLPVSFLTAQHTSERLSVPFAHSFSEEAAILGDDLVSGLVSSLVGVESCLLLS